MKQHLKLFDLNIETLNLEIQIYVFTIRNNTNMQHEYL